MPCKQQALNSPTISPQNILPKAVLDGDLETPSYIAHPKRIQRSPSYLYKKGNIFYFRYKFTAKEKEHFQHAEFRISLKTGFVHEAKKLARRLRSKLEGLIMGNQKNLSYNELKEKLAKELITILDSCPIKNPPPITEIKRRMEILRQKLLDTADSVLYQPEEGYLFENEQLIKVSTKTNLDHSFCLQKLAVNDPNLLLSIHFPHTIVKLLKEKIFTPDELTDDSILTIINEYHKNANIFKPHFI